MVTTTHSESNTTSGEAVRARNYFATTHWSVVLCAGRQDTTRSTIALEKLCQTYWFPLYAYARRRGFSAHDAQDLTQGFFECLLERQSLANADPNRGRFRSFILGAMNHFMRDKWEKGRAQKRGGEHFQPLSIELAAAEKRFDLEPASHITPDLAFEKEWATALLDVVLSRLQQEYVGAGKADLFDALKVALSAGEGAISYAELAPRLKMTEGNLRVAAHRLRKRYRELLRAEIANTVSSPGEINDEMRHLFKTMLNG
jgi:DNA-directed RNA polymerase specialized sigma24 family protein